MKSSRIKNVFGRVFVSNMPFLKLDKNKYFWCILATSQGDCFGAQWEDLIIWVRECLLSRSIPAESTSNECSQSEKLFFLCRTLFVYCKFRIPTALILYLWSEDKLGQSFKQSADWVELLFRKQKWEYYNMFPVAEWIYSLEDATSF